MANKFLNQDGLQYLWNKITSIFASKTYVNDTINTALNVDDSNVATMDAGNITEYSERS